MNKGLKDIIYIVFYSVGIALVFILIIVLSIPQQTKEIPMNELYKYLEGEEIIEEAGITCFIHKKYNKLIYVNKDNAFQVVDFEEKYYLEEKQEVKTDG